MLAVRLEGKNLESNKITTRLRKHCLWCREEKVYCQPDKSSNIFKEDRSILVYYNGKEKDNKIQNL